MFKCLLCGKVFESRFALMGHIGGKHRNIPWNSKGISVKELERLWKEGLSPSEIARELGCTNVNVINRLKAMGIYDPEEAKKRARALISKKIKEHRKRWNPVNDPRVRKRISQTIKRLHKDPAYRRKFIAGRKKIPPEKWKEISMIGCSASLKRPTRLEMKFIKLIKKYNLPYRYTGNGILWIAGLNPDFIHVRRNIILEVFGDYWHDKNDEVKRKEHYLKHGYKCFVIWEHELDKLSEEEIINKINRFLNS